MESQLSNALLDVKLPYEFMKKEFFEICEYYEKMGKNQKICDLYQIFKICFFDK